MPDKKNIIAIDGPSGVGKSTVSRKVAAAVGFTYLDTGAMYRAVGLHFFRLKVQLGDNKKVGKALEALTLDLIPAVEEESDVRVILNGDEVSEAIRTPEMAMVASRVSADSTVRQFLTRIQQRYGAAGRIVAEGRDIGTVVFPEAAYKFFLDAQPEERARRRALQLQKKGCPADFAEILAMTLARDHQDRNREVAPLRPAEDAVVIDTTGIDIAEVVDRILVVVRGKGISAGK